MTYQCQRGPPNNQNSNAAAPENGPYDNYLQLRKDAMRIPKQFFFKNRTASNENHQVDGAAGDYFSFHTVTEENKDDRRGGRMASSNSRV